MTEFLTGSFTIAAGALVVAVVAIGLAVIVARSAVRRAAVAERKLDALYAEIERAIGDRVDRAASVRWRDQLAAELGRLANAPRPVADHEDADDWVAAALQALDAAGHSIARLSPVGEPGRIAAALGLAGRLDESRRALDAVERASELEDALVSGALNDILTTAPLMSAYFAREAALVPVIEACQLAAAAVRLALAEGGITVEMPVVPSIVSSREARGETFDIRELRRIPQAKEVANRVADRLAPWETLVVYCTAPGWTKGDARRPPALVFWTHASWLA